MARARHNCPVMASQHTRRRRTRTGKGFSMLIHEYFTSSEYAELSPRAVKALIDIYTQFRGSNNGDLTAAWSVMAKRGWTSKDQLSKALRELLERGWLTVTRQGGFEGGKHRPRLYAVTWLGIDYCDGKLDVQPHPAPSHAWKRRDKIIVLPRHTGQPDPHHGSVVSEKSAHRPAPRVSGGG
jgi:hypothetical protein